MIESAFTLLARKAYAKVQLDDARRAAQRDLTEENKCRFDAALKEFRKANRQVKKMDQEENWI